MPDSELSIPVMDNDNLEPLFQMYWDVVEDGGAMPVGGHPTIEVFEEGWIRNRFVFVAWRDGRAVGTYFLRSNFPAFAAHIAQAGYIVAREARRSGIGTAMLRHSLDQARNLGFTAMMFNLVLESNPSRRLYEAAGFAVVGRVPEARADEPGLIYWRRLCPSDKSPAAAVACQTHGEQGGATKLPAATADEPRRGSAGPYDSSAGGCCRDRGDLASHWRFDRSRPSELSNATRLQVRQRPGRVREEG